MKGQRQRPDCQWQQMQPVPFAALYWPVFSKVGVNRHEGRGPRMALPALYSLYKETGPQGARRQITDSNTGSKQTDIKMSSKEAEPLWDANIYFLEGVGFDAFLEHPAFNKSPTLLQTCNEHHVSTPSVREACVLFLTTQPLPLADTFCMLRAAHPLCSLPGKYFIHTQKRKKSLVEISKLNWVISPPLSLAIKLYFENNDNMGIHTEKIMSWTLLAFIHHKTECHSTYN